MNPATTHWSDVLDSRLREVVPRGAAVALFDFPFHLNPGDLAIAAGELSWLARNGSRVVSMTRRETVESGYWPEIPEGVIVLFQGGGNIGDLYPEHRLLFEQMLLRYPYHDVVMAPQSVNFRDPAEATELAALLEKHRGQVTMLWRDTFSHNTASRLAPGARHVLAPDAAAGFPGWQRLSSPVFDVTYLLRRDEEASARPPEVQTGSSDWPYSAADKIAWRAMLLGHHLLDRKPSATEARRRKLYGALATMVLRNCLRLLSTSDVVVTDRLHGHILSTLMGVPNVVLADSYGKVRNYYETWSREIPLTAFASSWDEVPALVRRMQAAARSGQFAPE